MKTKRKTILAVSVGILIIVLSSTAVFSNIPSSTKADELARVACLGDSITQFTGYPADLQKLLGNSSSVGNFGVSGATVNFDSAVPYYYEPAFRHAKAFEPTTVIIMLGTNDARNDTFQKVGSFVADYDRMIKSLQAQKISPQIFLVEPPPIYNNTLGLNSTDFAQGIIPRIQEVASQLGLPIINVYTPLQNHPEDFMDGVHPNSAGAQEIANIIYEALESYST